jgi:hypothetical protein
MSLPIPPNVTLVNAFCSAPPTPRRTTCVIHPGFLLTVSQGLLDEATLQVTTGRDAEVSQARWPILIGRRNLVPLQELQHAPDELRFHALRANPERLRDPPIPSWRSMARSSR